MTGRRSVRMAAAAAASALGLVATGCGGGDSPTATATTVRIPSTSTPSTTVTSKPAPTTTAPVPASFVDDVLAGGDEAERYTFRLTFPKLQGLADTSLQDSINADIRAAVGVVLDEFVTGAKDFGAPPPPLDDQKSSLDGDYEVGRLDEGLASVGVRVSRFFAGGAHPGAVLLTFNYDLDTGRKLALAELFAPGAPYLERLSDLSRQLLLAQPSFDQVREFVLPGTEPKAENFAGWTLTDQDLVITFAEYQVGPYAMGMPHVSIPFASLRTLLDPAGPLAIHN